jgi:RNA polymerase sigma factor (sigma-70 family)
VPQPSLTDEELLRRVADGDRAAFSELYDRHARVAYAVALRTCRSAPLAEDVLQDAFLQLWRDAGAFRAERGAAAGWLLTIVRHRAIDAVRRAGTVERHRGRDDLLDDQPDGGAALYELTHARERERVVAGALAQLPDLQRTVIELAYFDGLSQTEIGAALGIPLGTVKSRARLGLERLARDQEVIGLAA